MPLHPKFPGGPPTLPPTLGHEPFDEELMRRQRRGYQQESKPCAFCDGSGRVGQGTLRTICTACMGSGRSRY
jgi:hypothetical protein